MAEIAKILLVEDEALKAQALKARLEAARYKVRTAASPTEAEPLLAREKFDAVVTDLRMPGRDGLSLLRDIKSRTPDQIVIVVTAFGTVETAVEAMKLGAFDYLQKPFSAEQLMLKLDRALSYGALARENEKLRKQIRSGREDTRIIGASDAIRRALARIHAVAATDATVLITGESGVGKELAARAIHESSHRSKGAFIAVSCAALPRELFEAELFGHEAGAFTGANRRRIGRIEMAQGGTLFLDDVDDIPLDIQVKLLRVIQERCFERLGGEDTIRVDVRLVAATKNDLEALSAQGEFREDLFYRLNVVPLRLPPLRERIEDIPLLVEHFLDKYALKHNRMPMKIAPEAVELLQSYHWPGNVRELENLIERMVALSDGGRLGAEDVPTLKKRDARAEAVSLNLDAADRLDMQSVMIDVERRLINWAMDRAGGNVARAAALLGVPRSTLQYRLTKV